MNEEMTSRRYSPEMVDYEFGGLNSVSDDFRRILAISIAKLPEKIIEWTTENLIFFSSTDAEWAYSIPIEFWNLKKGFVFLCENLKNPNPHFQAKSIAHEIAHFILKHKSPIMHDLTDEESRKQEKEADELALKWLKSSKKNNLIAQT